MDLFTLVAVNRMNGQIPGRFQPSTCLGFFHVFYIEGCFPPLKNLETRSSNLLTHAPVAVGDNFSRIALQAFRTLDLRVFALTI